MRHKNEQKILELFFEYPEKSFTVRGISKITGIPRATVHNYLAELKKEKLVSKENRAESSIKFKTVKINSFIEKLVFSGLIEEIVKELNPSCVILFGSIRKGDSIKESDIDLFVESQISKKINFKKYEKKLKHKVQLFVENDINKLQPNLFNNVVNGVKIYGSFKVK